MKENRSDSVRHLQSLEDTMIRYHGEILRLVDSASIVCQEHGGDDFHCPLETNQKCPFTLWHGCRLDIIKDCIGEQK